VLPLIEAQLAQVAINTNSIMSASASNSEVEKFMVTQLALTARKSQSLFLTQLLLLQCFERSIDVLLRSLPRYQSR
jgi:hypothetical protein